MSSFWNLMVHRVTINPNKVNVYKNIEYFEKHHNPDVLPYSINYDSNVPGISLIIFGGIHGNEPTGIESVIKIHKKIKRNEIELKKGKLTFILGNPEAYRKYKRYINSDLNRSFLNNLNSNCEVNRAKEITKFIDSVSRKTIIIDLHSVSSGTIQMLAYKEESKDDNEIIKLFGNIGTHFMFHNKHLNGTLIDYAQSKGLKCYSLECGNHNSMDTVKFATNQILRVLKIFGMIDYELENIQDKSDITIYETIETIKGNVTFNTKKLGRLRTGIEIKKGTVYAHDENKNECVAKETCYIVLPSNKPKARDVDSGFLCSRKIIKK